MPDRARREGREGLLRALDALLTKVEKPTRYLGGEWNSVTKDPSEVELSVLLGFPDTYEIGMSHLGYRILYGMLNERADVAAERAFMPWSDMLELLREKDLPLVSLETRRPLCEFDLVGFSMQSELTCTNVLAMLERGGIPLTSAERSEGDPLVLMGGPVIFNPEPFADFADAILAGDAEMAFPAMIDTYRRLKGEGASRLDILRAIAKIEGWYVPALYDAEPEPQCGLLIPRPKEGEDVPARVKRAIVYDLNEHPFPSKVIVPHAEVVHDRVSWEVMRGCPVGCRFCQAGYVYRPTRERDPALVAEGVRQSIQETGYDEFSLSSLNTGEYGPVEPLMTALMDEMEPQMVSVSLGSLHASTMTETLAEQVKRVRKSGFTMAPEAGSERMRRVINKNLTEEQILEACRLAFVADWKLLKLYFMIGLPTETMEDVDGIVELSGKILAMGRELGGKRVKVTTSASTFIPKPFTPFQWFGMATEEDFHAKQDRIKSTMPRGVQFKHHDRRESWLEGVLSRADRSMGAVIRKAFEKGAILDAWSEHMRLDLWKEALEECGIDGELWATRHLPIDVELPWEVIDVVIRRKWLEYEYKRAMSERTVVPCHSEACAGCAPFARECVKGSLAEQKWSDYVPDLSALPQTGAQGFALPAVPRSAEAPIVAATALAAGAEAPSAEAASAQAGAAARPETADEPAPPPPAPVYAYRARFAKQGRARFLGHLDLVRALTQSFRRAGVAFAYSRGFKPKPKVSLSPALGLGIASREEFLDFETPSRLEPETFCARLNAALPEGLSFSAIVPRENRCESLQESIREATYRVEIPGVGAREMELAAESWAQQETIEIQRTRKRKTKRFDLKPLVSRIVVAEDGRLEFALVMRQEGSARPLEVLTALFGAELAEEALLERVRLLAESGDRLVSPLLAPRQLVAS